ncbi:MAG: tripartite tricarboxylate transporter substrate binding protein [Betaproteobacteria bacterium]|nr:tripartite tricarboxylate transporter substrate binding protein [Betaproteobacteria bacterium]
MRVVLFFSAAVLVSGMSPEGLAQKYPVKPMRLISAFAPGGGTDILARAIATPVSESFGQPVVVDNRPGAGGATGSELVARATPDGYTIIMVASTYAATSAYGNPPYDPINGIQPIILIGTTGLVMTVHPSVPAKSVRELIDYAKANPGKLNYASVGAGSVPHLTHELFRLETRINLVHVPYKGAGPVLIALVAGEVQLTAISMIAILPHIKAGRLRALAITNPTRSSLLPDVPTISETVPGFEVIHWYGIWGPKGMPEPIVARWNKEVAKILRTEEMKNRTRGEGLETAGGSPEELGEIIRRDVEKWRRVIREAKISREG